MKADRLAASTPQNCTAIGDLDHPLNQDCDIIAIYVKGVSDFDNPAEKLVNTLLEVRQTSADEHNRLQVLISNYHPEGEETDD